MLAWGANFSGEATVPLAAQSGVVAITTGFGHSLALKKDGTVVAWGYNEYGQVTGIPTPVDPYAAATNQVTLGGQVLSEVMALAGGFGYTAVITIPPPALSLTTIANSNNLTLLWPDTATGYRVVSTLSLASPLTWINVSGVFQTNNGSISMVLPMTGEKKFYRLVKP